MYCSFYLLWVPNHSITGYEPTKPLIRLPEKKIDNTSPARGGNILEEHGDVT